MDLLQLTYFCDAAETQNFSETAKKFTVPTSNISQCIKRLESELGVTLFDRSVNRIQLNDRGRAFYEEVRQALDLLEGAKKAARAYEDTKELIICVHAHRRIVMQAITRFRLTEPDVKLIIRHDITNIREADFVISDSELALPDFRRSILLQERMLLAARKGEIPDSIEELASRPFITMSQSSNLLSITRRICRDMGFTPKIALQSEDPYYFRQCLELGLGVAFVPALTWRGQFSEQIDFKELGHYYREICVYRRPEAVGMKYADDFYQLLFDEFEHEARS